MYVGRIVAIGRSASGSNAVMYRVSSRSFPNRQAVDTGLALAIVPRVGFEADVSKNPYIAYNALRLAGDWAIATNGSHTDPITEKIDAGMPVREALALTLIAMDYEKDDFNTPRVAAVVPRSGDTGWLAIVKKSGLVVQEVSLVVGQVKYVATYEADDVRDEQISEFDAKTAAEAASFCVSGGAFANLEKPVTAAAALTNDADFTLGTFTVEA